MDTVIPYVMVNVLINAAYPKMWEKLLYITSMHSEVNQEIVKYIRDAMSII